VSETKVHNTVPQESGQKGPDSCTDASVSCAGRATQCALGQWKRTHLRPHRHRQRAQRAVSTEVAGRFYGLWTTDLAGRKQAESAATKKGRCTMQAWKQAVLLVCRTCCSVETSRWRQTPARIRTWLNASRSTALESVVLTNHSYCHNRPDNSTPRQVNEHMSTVHTASHSIWKATTTPPVLLY